jgi:hypothetical protein
LARPPPAQRRGRHLHAGAAGAPGAAPLPHLRAIDLYGAWDTAPWELGDQTGHPSCVGFVVAACVELMRARSSVGMTFVPQSPIFLYRKIREASWPGLPPPPDWDEGAVKLGQAAQILETTGICSLERWPANNPAHNPSVPDATEAEAEAMVNRISGHQYLDWGTADPRHNVALAIYTELAAGRPVGVTLPEFKVRHGDWPDWHSDAAIATGEVPDPETEVQMSGHAVCLIGFQPSAAEPMGGYFLFRNSWGTEWAANAPDGPPERTPYVPTPGYGTISATHLERYASEMLSLALPAVPAP